MALKKYLLIVGVAAIAIAAISVAILTTNSGRAQKHVYGFTLDASTWSVEEVFYYPMDEQAYNLVNDMRVKRSRINDLPRQYEFEMQFGDNTYKTMFYRTQLKIVEDFSDNYGIKLVSTEEIDLEKIDIRVISDRKITSGDVVVTVSSPTGESLGMQIYKVATQNGVSTFSIEGRSINVAVLPIRTTSLPTVTKCDVLNEVMPNYNRTNENRINIVFRGVGSERDSGGVPEFVPILPNLIDITSKGTSSTETFDGFRFGPSYGIFGEEPFKSNKDKFNFWWSDNIHRSGSDVGHIPPIAYCEFQNVQEIYVVDITGRGWASTGGGRAFVYQQLPTTAANAIAALARVAVHEFGHSFGGLADEYVQKSRGDQPYYPNCLNSPSNDWREDKPYDGCSYVHGNWRPSWNSIMRVHSAGTFDFQETNEKHICARIALMTGSSSCVDFDRVALAQGELCSSDRQCKSEICGEPIGLNRHLQRQCLSFCSESSSRHCLRQNLPNGKRCISNEQCEADSFCNHLHTCRLKLDVGEECRYGSHDCKSNLECTVDTRSGTGTSCQPL